jgi:ketosteroid isomerase-like protein
VPEEPIEVIRVLNGWWKRRPFERARELLLASVDWDDAVRRFNEAGFPADPVDPDVEVVVDAFPEGPPVIGLRGRDAWIRFWQDWIRPWRDLVLDDSHYEQIGDHVLVEMSVEVTPRDDGERVELDIVQLFKLRDGLIRMYAVYSTRDEALAAIPLER